MTITGTVVNGVVVPDAGQTLPEGAKVTVSVPGSGAAAGAAQPASSLSAIFLKFAGTAVGLPEDMADQHDHYLHGTPKR